MSEIAVVIPAYNAERTIERTVRSVLASTIPVEVWVVDDGSTDGTAQILARFGEAIHVLRQPNRGAYQARLAALTRITTPYFGFVDADDTIEPAMYERALAFMKASGLDVVQVNARPPQRILEGAALLREEVLPVLWQGRTSSFIWDKVYRHQYDFSAFEATDGITNFDDLVFNLQFFRSVKRMGFLDEELYHYSATPGSAARRFRWRLMHDLFETFRLRCVLSRGYRLRPLGTHNLRWLAKNLRNVGAIFVKSFAGACRRKGEGE